MECAANPTVVYVVDAIMLAGGSALGTLVGLAILLFMYKMIIST